MSEPTTRPLAELLVSGPIEYQRFLYYAGQLARLLEKMHAEGKAHGAINPLSLRISSENELSLDGPSAYREITEENVRDDLYQVGMVFTQMLVTSGGGAGQPIHPIVSEHAPLESATALIPVEAKLLLEELLAADPKERIATARELVSTINEMNELARMPEEPSVPEKKDRSRAYFAFAMTILVALVVWVLLEVYHKL